MYAGVLDEDTRTDALLNDMSTFIQALGRVERTWNEMPDQTVLFSPEVDRCFQAFCSPAFDERRVARAPIQSENLRQLFEQVQVRSVHLDRQIRRQKDKRLHPQNALCQQNVGALLQRLVQVRQGNEDHEACRHWEQLRKAVLRHDFKDTLLQRYACVMESPHYQKGKLHLDAHNDIIPADLLRHDGYRWNMNALYERIRLNPVIADYFRGEGYELAFDHINKAFFVPYCFQAILTGAIGEEAIRALLLEEGIMFEPVPERLFEVADLKIAGFPYYIDCKYYSDWTMQHFSIPPEDPAYHGKLNDAHFKVHARKKLDTISTYHGEPGKLLYINLVSHFSRPLDYYTEDFTPVEDFTDASIVVVQGHCRKTRSHYLKYRFSAYVRI